MRCVTRRPGLPGDCLKGAPNPSSHELIASFTSELPVRFECLPHPVITCYAKRFRVSHEQNRLDSESIQSLCKYSWIEPRAYPKEFLLLASGRRTVKASGRSAVAGLSTWILSPRSQRTILACAAPADMLCMSCTESSSAYFVNRFAYAPSASACSYTCTASRRCSPRPPPPTD